MDPVAEVGRHVRWARDVVVLATGLLRACRRHAERLLGALDTPGGRQQLAEDRRRFAALLEGAGTALARAEAERLAAAYEAAGRTGDFVVAARALAVALDEVLGPRFLDCFRSRGAREVREGEAFPVAANDVRALLQGSLSPRPEELARGVDGLRWLRLVPPLPPHLRVRLSWEAGPALATFPDAPVVAFAVPNARLADFTWDVLPPGRPERFFRVRPVDEPTQAERLLGLLARAEAAGATLALFPELCLTPALARRVETWLRTSARRLSLVLAGSLHREARGRRTNTALVLAPGGVRLLHHKFNPFTLPAAEGGARLHEDIRTTPATLTVHFSARWSFATLVCKDALDPRVGPLLAELRVGLLLVAALSPKTAPFQAEAAALTARAQTLVLVANLGDAPRHEPDAALASLPLARDGLLRTPAHALQAPGLLVLDMRGLRRLLKS